MTETHTSLVARIHRKSPYTLGEFHVRFPWVLPAVAIVFTLLALGAALDVLFWDEPITRFVLDQRTPTLDRIARRVSWFGSTKVVIPVALLAALASWRRCPRLALALVAIALTRPLLEHTIKVLVDRERPAGDQLVPGNGPSFPSGHPLATAASWGLLPLVVGLYTARRAVWWATAGLVWTLAVAVAASRVYLGVHWASDVVGGLILASVCVLAGERFIDAVHGPECGPPRPPRAARRRSNTGTLDASRST